MILRRRLKGRLIGLRLRFPTYIISIAQRSPRVRRLIVRKSSLISAENEIPAGAELSQEHLLRIYGIAVDEYRFQVNLNWLRTQYYLVFNVGIVALATTLVRFITGGLQLFVATLYIVGFVCCLLCLAATRSQEEYYHAARDHIAVVEKRLGLTDLRLGTTPGMTGLVRRFGKVKTFNRVLLWLIAVLNIVGSGTVVFLFVRSASSETPTVQHQSPMSVTQSPPRRLVPAKAAFVIRDP